MFIKRNSLKNNKSSSHSVPQKKDNISSSKPIERKVISMNPEDFKKITFKKTVVNSVKPYQQNLLDPMLRDHEKMM